MFLLKKWLEFETVPGQSVQTVDLKTIPCLLPKHILSYQILVLVSSTYRTTIMEINYAFTTINT